ncbi:hypothetical protein DM611_09270 [Stenotrophomonas maltophilia]|nr:hypothetical protein DM611_09270 [Stenotrophomonas maltophilia]
MLIIAIFLIPSGCDENRATVRAQHEDVATTVHPERAGVSHGAQERADLVLCYELCVLIADNTCTATHEIASVSDTAQQTHIPHRLHRSKAATRCHTIMAARSYRRS